MGMRKSISRSKSAPVGVIGKVLRLLELLDRSPAGLQLKEIARETGMNKSTVYRFLSHLDAEGYLFRDSAGLYMIGPKLARLGSGLSFQATLCRICRPILENLRKATDETVNLGVLDGSEVLYLDVLESLHTFRLVSQPGMRRPAYCTSLGKAMLANLDDQQRREEIYASIQFESRTSRTLTSIARLKKDLAHIEKQGFSLDDEEAVVGARCVGAAILGADGKLAGGISVSGPVVRVSRERLPFFAAEVSKAAREISWRLGYQALPPGRDEGESRKAVTSRGAQSLPGPASRKTAPR